MAEPIVHDLVGVGIGPFNLSLAALADAAPGLSALFLDAKPAFSWHPGLLLDGTVLQVPFLADLVTLADPTSRWTYLNYLREHDRMFPFFFSERFHIPRREYDHYCRWVANSLPSCRFGAQVTDITPDEGASALAVTFRSGPGSATTRVLARQVVLGVGTQPVVPQPLRRYVRAAAHAGRVLHSADYRTHRAELARARDVTVVGGGQSGAEIVLDLLRHYTEPDPRPDPRPHPGAHPRPHPGAETAPDTAPETAPAPEPGAAGERGPHGGPFVRWVARTPAFAPMEYSKIGLEHFTPDYVRYFRALPEDRRDQLLARQWQLYKGVSEETLADIHDLLYERTIGGAPAPASLHPGVTVAGISALEEGGYELACRHDEQGTSFTVRTDAVVSATGYAAVRPPFLDGMVKLIDWDEKGRYRIDGSYRVALEPGVPGALYVQNAELHTHGVGAPDLTLGAWRAATILNAVAGRTVLRVPEQAAWTTFGAPPPDVRGPALPGGAGDAAQPG
ncbi:lysine N(6)-hydroxylase/L-ornithine N(5)-oxygenase family protein [Streptomyces fuscigenes]|uniref:lysine N(6)-hydroxylase/L-ornithine N(5)-oxygenase family protein n=1 Tax=Streptomyces fuscigenes TaxID=1528880 RepID=UPI001F3DC099|nr:SidA/IucD/PvdA family monooxygenase [Streptomyces fuscigenes]MCF3962039.1 SidA/IucD/PvdA family monooxygenase [Streptomyces fuscigenes]